MGTAGLRCSERRAADTHADHGWGAIRLRTSEVWMQQLDAIGRISTLTNFTFKKANSCKFPFHEAVTLVYSVCLLFRFRGLRPSSAVLNFRFVFSFREIDRADLQLCCVATRSSCHRSQCHGCQKRHWRDGTAIKIVCLEFKSDRGNASRLFEHVSIRGEEHLSFFSYSLSNSDFECQILCPCPSMRWQRHEGFEDFLQLHSSGGKMSVLLRLMRNKCSKDSKFFELYIYIFIYE